MSWLARRDRYVVKHDTSPTQLIRASQKRSQSRRRLHHHQRPAESLLGIRAIAASLPVCCSIRIIRFTGQRSFRIGSSNCAVGFHGTLTGGCSSSRVNGVNPDLTSVFGGVSRHWSLKLCAAGSGAAVLFSNPFAPAIARMIPVPCTCLNDTLSSIENA